MQKSINNSFKINTRGQKSEAGVQKLDSSRFCADGSTVKVELTLSAFCSSRGQPCTRLRWRHKSHMTDIRSTFRPVTSDLSGMSISSRPPWKRSHSDRSAIVCHSWKISSSRSLRFLVSLVMVSGTAPCAASCCPLEDEPALRDLTRGRQAGVSPEQTSSTAANLRKNPLGQSA